METNGYRLLLPEGILDYFIISDVKENSSEIVIYLEEKNEVPSEYSNIKVESKGFYAPVVVQDFPIRGKTLFLNGVGSFKANTSGAEGGRIICIAKKK